MSKPANWIFGTGLLVVCLALVAEQYSCPSCTTGDDFAWEGAKVAWQHKSGVDFATSGVTFEIDGADGVVAVITSRFPPAPPPLSFLSPLILDLTKLITTATLYSSNGLPTGTQQTQTRTLYDITVSLVSEGRSISYPISRVIEGLSTQNDYNNFYTTYNSSYNWSSQHSGLIPIAYAGVPVVNVSGSVINNKWVCWQTDTGTMCGSY